MKLIILDRDGVINYDSEHYIKTPAEWMPIPGSLAAMAKLYQAGWTISIATNQSGIARGLYSHETLAAIHQKMCAMVEVEGGKVDSIFYCPHHPSENCNCRKPAPGLVEQIYQYYGLGLTHTPFIGDKWTDMQTALAAGCQPILVQTGLKITQPELDIAVLEFANLSLAADYLLNHPA
jgi:D-glycero-D-manno-heptose 1,7-bisphosphate phosphatase